MRLSRIPILVLYINPAPVWDKRKAKKGEPEPEVHRENTPWLVSIPALGITVQAHDTGGEPIMGYWNLREADDWAVGLWNQLQADPALLKKLQGNPEGPLSVSRYPKVMQRILFVPEPAD